MMSEWQWVQRLDSKMDDDEFLQENRIGATVGQGVGGAAGIAAAGAGVLYTAAATAPAAAAAQAVGTATMAAGGVGAVAYRAGYFAGRTAAKAAVRNTAYAAFTLGRFGGAYVGAGIQSGARRIGAKIREL